MVEIGEVIPTVDEGDVDVTPRDAKEVTPKERSAVYTAAESRLRAKYRDEFDGYLIEGYKAIGIEWAPKPNEVQKAKAEIERLLTEHPELRKLFAIGNDPANPQ